VCNEKERFSQTKHDMAIVAMVLVCGLSNGAIFNDFELFAVEYVKNSTRQRHSCNRTKNLHTLSEEGNVEKTVSVLLYCVLL